MLITTYSMISFAGQRSEIAKKIIDTITKREWGFMLLDEVFLRLDRVCRLGHACGFGDMVIVRGGEQSMRELVPQGVNALHV